MIPNRKTHQINQISGQQTKFSITIYAFMYLCFIISALLYLLHFLLLHKSLVYPPSVHILYDECNEDVTGEYSSAKYQWRNWGTLGAIAPPSREKLLFLKEYKNEIFHLVLSHFFASCPFRRVAKIIQNESFKDNICSIGIVCAIVWFRHVHLQKQPPDVFFKKVVLKNSAIFTGNTCAGVSFVTLLLVPCGEIWLGWIHQLPSVGRLLQNK